MNKASQSMSRTEDAQWLTKFVNDRDEDAFRRLVQKYERLVWNVCCRILDNRCDAEDAFQNTFSVLANRAKRIRKPRSLASWLYGVAFRTANTVRRQRHREAVPLCEIPDPKSGNDVLEFIARKNENELVCAELMLMSERYKTPLVLFYFSGQTVPQISASTGLSVSAIESRLRRGRMALKSRLVSQGVEPRAMLALATLSPAFELNQFLLHETVSSCVSASVGSWGTALTESGNLLHQTGVSLMLKSAIVLCITGMLGVGVALHHDGSQSEEQQIELTLVQPNVTPGAQYFQVKLEHEAELDEETSGSVFEAFHSLLDHWHQGLYQHFMELHYNNDEQFRFEAQLDEEEAELILLGVEDESAPVEIFVEESTGGKFVFEVVNELNDEQDD